jgi:YbgC/YbaW family acyl-CoA thioester hydrolase
VTEFFRVNVRVHWADTDAAGIVWFGNFFRFFEEAEDEMFRALGRTRLELVRDFGILMPRLEASCRFRSPARAEEVLSVGIAVLELTERRIKYAFEAHERDMQRLVCEGSYRVACVTADTFKPCDFPAGMRLLIKRLPEIISEQTSPRRRPSPGWT